MFNMRKTLVAVLSLLHLTSGLNILLTNDDGFGSANLREFYRLLVAAGHDTYVVAPVVDNSGQGGRTVFTTSPNLTTPSEFNLVPAGAPSLGQDPTDSHIWYYNGTPGACTLVGLDYILPTFGSFSVPDLVVSGPNFGDNIGTWVYTGSGTIGAAYFAVERNIPAIAFSATNPTLSYKNITNTTNPATYAAALSVKLVNMIATATKPGQRIFPLGYGLNINFPALNTSCLNPPFIQSRFTGGAGMPKVQYNATTQLIQIAGSSYFGLMTDGLNQCINGDCSLPGESNVVKGCTTAVTIFTVDYDAPTNDKTAMVEALLGFKG